MGSREHISESAVLQPGMNEGKSKYVTAPVMPKGARARQEMRSKVGAEPVWRQEPQCTPASCPCSWGECVCWLQPLPDCKGMGTEARPWEMVLQAPDLMELGWGASAVSRALQGTPRTIPGATRNSGGLPGLSR